MSYPGGGRAVGVFMDPSFFNPSLHLTLAAVRDSGYRGCTPLRYFKSGGRTLLRSFNCICHIKYATAFLAVEHVVLCQKCSNNLEGIVPLCPFQRSMSDAGDPIVAWGIA